MRKLVPALILLPAICLGVYDTKWLDVNRWLCPFHNDGRYAYDPAQGGEAGASWPQPLKNKYIYGAGPWVGSIVGNDTLVSFGYNPNTGGSEFGPTLNRYWREGTENPADRVYRYPDDWPPPLSRFPMAPQQPRADMQLWCSFGDSNPENHSAPGRPLGIDIYLTAFGYNDSLAGDFFFLSYELANTSGSELSDVYFGLVVDPDIGQAVDDMLGLLLNDSVAGVGWVRNVAFAGDHNNVEYPTGRGQWESGTPGVVAVKLLQAPEGLGLSTFKKFAIETDPGDDPAQYLMMAGYNPRTGVYEPYDSLDLEPGDKRFLMSTGPFDLQPDSVATFAYAVIGAPYGGWSQSWEDRRLPYNDSLTLLALRCHLVRQVFEEGVAIKEPELLPVTSPRPAAGIIRGMLYLPEPTDEDRSPVGALHDIAGRKVMVLRPGENDVHHLSPGVYFVRQMSGPMPIGPRVSRIIIAR